ncbi:hypothetical protein [Methylobacterium sp. J-070]|uniref:hypothetical protein n=1 Tax=Methylobacterium sp. J-070 TaxID=2836650 RepID=UPI001FBA8243|nr:hypothetical protein [Methylobacterium sp. J-070]MCJ2050284.1 hypothetical protein [Methylobacterium sp. J-070]
MSVSSAPTVLFFRVYREISLPLYTALVEQLCHSADLPFQLATVLEDIGQGFIRLGETVNAALARRGLLDREVDADLTVEARIEAVMADGTLSELIKRLTADGHRDSMLTEESIRQAFGVGFVLTHDLPLAGRL